MQHMPLSKRWSMVSFGLLMGGIGTLVLFWISIQWENAFRKIPVLNTPFTPQLEIPPPLSQIHTLDPPKTSENNRDLEAALKTLENQLTETQAKLAAKSEENQKNLQDNQRYQRQAELVLQEFAQFKKNAQEQLEHRALLIADSQQTIAEQRAAVEKKQQQIGLLESKVRDLTYEIKTLLQLAEIGSHDPIVQESEPFESSIKPFADVEQSEDTEIHLQIHSAEDANVLLKRCIDIAQKMTGAGHYLSNHTRFRELTVDNYTLDLRRLFDSLRSENMGTVFFYSPKENKLLFVNSQTKNLIGWSSEKFVQNFFDIIQPGMEEWKNGLAQLSLKNETAFPLLMKTKSSQETIVQIHLGIIPTGLFRNQIIGVLWIKL